MSGFIDEAQMHVKAGDGGAGCVSFRREAHVAEGGPDGGNGGDGGSVWLVADRNVASLLAFKDHPHRKADPGHHGSGKAKHGKRGEDTLVLVPEGTVIKSLEGEIVADLANAGDRFCAGEGGRGGRGNDSFSSARRKAPTFAEQGEHGQERWYNIELKLMADVALVGFPNAGKSTFVTSVSRATPKIAAYPFTTLQPHLGVVRHRGAEFVVADIPGLIEGASEGKGLGFQFLRHIERARVLLVLVDLCADDLRSPAEQEQILLRELGQYRPELLERPRLVVGTKIDNPDAELWEDEWTGLRISSHTHVGLDDVLNKLAELVAGARAEAEAAAAGGGFVVHRLVPEGFHIMREDDGTFVVVGREAERAVALNDITEVTALHYVQQRLARLGIDKALHKAGARQGDPVRIGKLEFEYDE